MPRAPGRLLVAAALLWGAFPPPAAAAAAAARAAARRGRFVGELSFHVRQLGGLTAAAPAARAPRLLDPDAASVYMAAMAASPGRREEHEARQVLIEYTARPSLRAEIEASLEGGLDERSLSALRTLGRKLDALDSSAKRDFLRDVAALRRKLYTGASKSAAAEATRAHLARVFDGGAGTGATTSIEAGGAASASRPRLLKPAPGAAPWGGKDLWDMEQVDMDVEAAGEMLLVLDQFIERYALPITLPRLLSGLAREAAISGITLSSEEGPETREFLEALAKSLRAMIGSGLDGGRGHAWEALLALIQHGVVPIPKPRDFDRMAKAVAGRADQYTRFLDPREFREDQEDGVSRYAGIGAALIGKEGAPETLLVALVYPGSPAEQAGLAVDDVIESVDGRPVKSMEDSKRMLGRPGSFLRLGYSRDGVPDSVRIRRRVLDEPPHVGGRMLPGRPGVGYLTFQAFHMDTAGLVREELRRLRAAGMRTLILDLRFNIGGFLPVATEITGLFLRKGQVIRHVRQGRETDVARAVEDGEFADLPITVMTSRTTASGGELLAGALQDHKRALLVGERTRGKGVGQTTVPMRVRRRWTALVLTTLWWRTPKRRSVQSTDPETAGLAPDVPLAKDDKAMNAAFVAARNALWLGRWDTKPDPWLAIAADHAQRLLRVTRRRAP